MRLRPVANADDYYDLYCPKGFNAHTRPLLLIHGISRQPRVLLEAFRMIAEQHNLLLIAPLFSQAQHPRYQRLGLKAGEQRADLYLNRILNELGQQLALDCSRFHLFGFSGGAQFSHRYALLHPQRVLSLSLGAAGWYSLPDPLRRFPYGIGANPAMPAWRPQLDAYLRIPCQVYVGSEDTLRDPSLNCSKRIDRTQGLDRLQRAQTWVEAINHCRAQTPSPYPTTEPTRLQVITRQGHAVEALLQTQPMQHTLRDFIGAQQPPISHPPRPAVCDWLATRRGQQRLHQHHHQMQQLLACLTPYRPEEDDRAA